MADDITVRSHSTTRASKLFAPSSICAHGTHSRLTSESSETQTRNTERLPLDDIGRFYGWDPNDQGHDNNLGHGGSVDGSQSDNGDNDFLKMSTWSGQPRVEGSSETVRMVLLTCVSIGITSVHVHYIDMKHVIADLLTVASPGVSR